MPARAVADDRDVRATRLGIFNESRQQFCWRPSAQSDNIAGDEDAGHRIAALFNEADEFIGGQFRDRLFVEKRRGSIGAEAETIDRLDRDPAVRRCAMPIDAEVGETMARDRLAVARLASLRPGRFSGYGGQPARAESHDRK